MIKNLPFVMHGAPETHSAIARKTSKADSGFIQLEAGGNPILILIGVLRIESDGHNFYVRGTYRL